MKSDAKAKRGGGRPVGPLVKKIKHFDRASTSKQIETDADQLRIKLALDIKYAGVPDVGRVIPKGSPEFERIAAELLARENAGVDMAVKFCSVPGCKKMAQHGCGGMCKAHYSAAQREAGAVAETGHAYALESGESADDLVCHVPSGKVANGVGESVPFGVDPVILLALREAWAAKEAGWLVELSGLKPGQAVCYAASMVKALEGLGY